MLRSEKIGYTFAAFFLVVAGAIFRTLILNWITGPAVVVCSVVLSNRLFGRFDTYESTVPNRDSQ